MRPDSPLTPGQPGWVRDLTEAYVSGAASVFILYGNVHDLVPVRDAENRITAYLPLEEYLSSQIFARRDVIIRYDRGSGIAFVDPNLERRRAARQDFQRALAALDLASGSDYARSLPRDPTQALEVLDRYLLQKLLESAAGGNGKRVALLLRYPELIVPSVDSAWLSGEVGANLVKILNWANDPRIREADITICLVTENLGELNRRLVENPFVAKVEVPIPDESARRDYLDHFAQDHPEAEGFGPDERKSLAQLSNGLTLVGLSQVVRRSLQAYGGLDLAHVKRAKKELVEKECFGLVDFVTPRYTLDMVVAQPAVRERLLEDARLIREARLGAVPMGYLLCGVLGTGKTFTATCFAGSIGIPAVVFRDIREKWVGSSERNMQKVLSVIRALGPVMVIVDEADAALGNRSADGDSGTSGRLFAMISNQMSNTEYRGRIIWMLLTCRPDLLPVDLKRQGRCEVHIPLFAPQTPEERCELMLTLGRKNGVDLDPASLPEIPEGLSGADLESIVVQAIRRAALKGMDRPDPAILAEVVHNFVSPNYSLQKELQELVAIRECTDLRFLPERYRSFLTDPEMGARLERRVRELAALVG
jgi:SpoVK/Ycf46/Vps4 family AAA+-type ATPase